MRNGNARVALVFGSFVLLLLMVSACSQDGEPELAPLDARASEGRYIVVLHAQADADAPAAGRARAADVARAHGLAPDFTYGAAIVGFASVIPDGRLNALQRDPRVKYVEEDGRVEIFAQEMPTGVRRINADDNANIGIDGSDDVRVDVDVAVIDTGVDFEHPDLNVVGGVTCALVGSGAPWMRDAVCDPGGDDDHYHGTHVAGTVAALDNGIGVVGVAPGARIWAVKVLDSSGSGYESQVVAGIDWVTEHAGTIEVANMSLGGSGYSAAEHDAIKAAVAAGVAFAVAAGNSDADANGYSPAGFAEVMTVSALADFDGEPGYGGSPTCRTDQDDTLADFSNWGSAVDIAAPGVCILSTYPIEQGEYGTISGTSMASPHVAGALALLASSSSPANEDDVFALYADVAGAGNGGWTDDSGDGMPEPLLDVSGTTLFAPNLLAGSGDGGGGDGGGDGGEANAAPTASFTYTCTDLTCDFDASGSTDSDGSISSFDWDFGDGATASGSAPTHTFGAGGSYTVVLTVADDDGATDTDSRSVAVTDSGSAAIDLTATGSKSKGLIAVDLSWSGATSTDVDVYRDGDLIATTKNDGAYTDDTGRRGGGTLTYRVCEAGTSTCSNEAAVTF